MTAFTVVMLRKLVSVVVTLPLDPVSLSKLKERSPSVRIVRVYC